MAKSHTITINGESFAGRRGDLLLDAALGNGVEMPYDCRKGHCGTCCVRLISGDVKGGQGSEPGVIHACQSRITGDAVIEMGKAGAARSVEGVLTSLRPLSREVWEVGIRTDRALPYHAGQYAQIQFNGYPSRPFSITHPLRGESGSRSIWFHVRRMDEGRVTRMLGKRIQIGHRVTVTGPYGSAHFRPNLDSRLILVATNTGFAPIWSIAVAALRENPKRKMMIIAGGRGIESLYMGPALGRLARFPNVRVIAVCSTPQTVSAAVKPGRPTDYLPRLRPTDVLYACGAPQMVDSIKSIAARAGAVCYADPFIPTADEKVEDGVLTRAIGWLALPTVAVRERIALANRQKRQLALEGPKRLAIEPPRKRHKQPAMAYRVPETRPRSGYGLQSA